jgi:hypothetical protein
MRTQNSEARTEKALVARQETEPVFLNLFGNPGIDSQPGGLQIRAQDYSPNGPKYDGRGRYFKDFGI